MKNGFSMVNPFLASSGGQDICPMDGASVGIFEVIIIYDICVQKFMIFKNGALNVA